MGIYNYEKMEGYAKETKIRNEIDVEMIELLLNNYILNDKKIKEEKKISVGIMCIQLGVPVLNFRGHGLSKIDTLSFNIPRVDFTGVTKYGGNENDRMFITNVDEEIKSKSKKIITKSGYEIYVNNGFVYSGLLMWDFEIIDLVKPSFFKKNGYAKIRIIKNEKVNKLENLLNEFLAKYDKKMCFSCYQWDELDGANREEKYNELKNKNESIITIDLNKVYSNFSGDSKESILFDYLLNSYSASWPLNLKGFIIDNRISNKVIPSNNKLISLGWIDNYYYSRNSFSKRERRPFLWRILKVEDDSALLLSDDAILIDKYDNDGDEYLKSYIRDKLLSLQNILNIKEDLLLKNNKDGLNDYFFLLSKGEVSEYLKEEDYVANCTAFAIPLDPEDPCFGPKDYHYRAGFDNLKLETPSNWSIEKSDDEFSTYVDKPVKWFLRDSKNGLCDVVNEKGEFETCNSSEQLGIRPAVWVKILDKFAKEKPKEVMDKEKIELDIKYKTWKK